MTLKTQKQLKDHLKLINESIIKCKKCPRLKEYGKRVGHAKRAAYKEQDYWARPVPNFGDPFGRFIIVGLAPGAHGAHRTGRMFTGDQSGLWLYRALYKAGFASQATSEHIKDGLILKGCLITAVAHCAPPQNKLEPQEILNCQCFLEALLEKSCVQVFLGLGEIAWKETFKFLKRHQRWVGAIPTFYHGHQVEVSKECWVVASYHPSQQNTFTKKLTEPMFDQVFKNINTLLKQLDS